MTWLMTGRARRLTVAVFCVMLVVVAVSVAVTPAPSASAVATTGQDVPRTEQGRGEFADLAVTVSATTNLTDQAVTVSWTGGEPTGRVTNLLGNYLQVMQCWGGPEGPDRENCQFGARRTYDVLSGSDGNTALGRQVYPASSATTDGALRDPLETLPVDFELAGTATVPFVSVRGETASDAPNRFFDHTTTNEVGYAITQADGTGFTRFQVQTAKTAPHLGCGAADSGGQPRRCWLVVVPRGFDEPGGVSNGRFLRSSPLSQSNWDDRLEFPLDFQPVIPVCERPRSSLQVFGHPLVTEAATQWLAGLCATDRANVNLLELNDLLVRFQLISSEQPILGIVSRPPEDDGSSVPGATGTFAPVAISGVTVAFVIDRQYFVFDEPEPLDAGTPVTEFALSPRLLAKLLTQSYRNSVPPGNPNVAENPGSLVEDPEFIALNPDFADYSVPAFSRLSDVLVPGDLLDAYDTVWRWILADPAAAAWLQGADDGNGMVVNEAFRSVPLPSTEFPRPDPYCAPPELAPNLSPSPPTIPYCLGDHRPLTSSLLDSARLGVRGDNGERSVYDVQPAPRWAGLPAGSSLGTRGVLVLTTTPYAERFGLATASLTDSAGRPVAPSVEAMQAAAGAAQRDEESGAFLVDPGDLPEGAYPLTVVSNAGVVRERIPQDELRAEAADIVRYLADTREVGRGPTLLAPGYAPLPDSLRAAALSAADAFEAPLAQAPEPSPNPSTTPSPVVTNAPTPTPFPPLGPVAGGGAAPTTGAVLPTLPAVAPAVPLPVDPATEESSPDELAISAVPALTATPATELSSLRLVPIAVLVAGLIGTVVAAVLSKVGRRARGGGGAA